MISDVRVLSSCTSRIMRNSGTAVTIAGNIRVERIQRDSRRLSLNGNSKRASAYAASVPMTSAHAVDVTATIALVSKY